MSYIQQIYPKPSKPVKLPSAKREVNLYVCRTNVFGSKMLGDRGLYHSGLLFESGNDSWVIDLAIKGNMSSLIPSLSKDGKKVIVNNTIVIEYYSPETWGEWNTYWQLKSKKVCTISAETCNKLQSYIIDTLAPNNNYYNLFSISDKALITITGDKSVTKATEYTGDNTCDKLPMKCFEWLNKNFGTEIKPFPITRMVLGVDSKPEKITDLSDKGLVKYVKSLRELTLRNILEETHNKNISDAFGFFSALYKQYKVKKISEILSLANLISELQLLYGKIAGSKEIKAKISDLITLITPIIVKKEQLTDTKKKKILDDLNKIVELVVGEITKSKPLPDFQALKTVLIGIYNEIKNMDTAEIAKDIENFNVLSYVPSIDLETNEQFYYKMPLTDVSITAVDLYNDLPKTISKKMQRVIYIMVSIVIMCLVGILIFLALKSR